MMQGDMSSACPHRQFFTLPGLLDSWAALRNAYPKAYVPSREAICTIFIMIFGMTRSGREPATYRMRGGTLTIKPTRRGFVSHNIRLVQIFAKRYIIVVHLYLDVTKQIVYLLLLFFFARKKFLESEKNCRRQHPSLKSCTRVIPQTKISDMVILLGDNLNSGE